MRQPLFESSLKEFSANFKKIELEINGKESFFCCARTTCCASRGNYSRGMRPVVLPRVMFF